jgi:hypothetical protein
VTIRDQVKAELDRVDDEYLGVVQRMIGSLERRSDQEDKPVESWKEFIASTYGSTAAAPIERGGQGEFEARDALR